MEFFLKSCHFMDFDFYCIGSKKLVFDDVDALKCLQSVFCCFAAVVVVLQPRMCSIFVKFHVNLKGYEFCL